MVGARVFWRGICTVYRKENVLDESTGRTVQKETVLYSDLPCHLSFHTVAAAGEGAAASLAQDVRVFLAPEITVPPGCRMKIVQDGMTEYYKLSGPPAVYTQHQEIPLTLEKRWA